ncbi:hypothetical protein CEXT_537431 [Caerostris extrusa]|uniref:Uncharacterized protein n=1 Tax=Caerostris extrusa TaxID=172846 RepID=A0AAV4XJG2_CAEEX|nr:hypothetical protein CEXT_537431 [Caerostris extrusa]
MISLPYPLPIFQRKQHLPKRMAIFAQHKRLPDEKQVGLPVHECSVHEFFCFFLAAFLFISDRKQHLPRRMVILTQHKRLPDEKQVGLPVDHPPR